MFSSSWKYYLKAFNIQRVIQNEILFLWLCKEGAAFSDRLVEAHGAEGSNVDIWMKPEKGKEVWLFQWDCESKLWTAAQCCFCKAQFNLQTDNSPADSPNMESNPVQGYPWNSLLLREGGTSFHIWSAFHFCSVYNLIFFKKIKILSPHREDDGPNNETRSYIKISVAHWYPFLK